MSTSKSAVCKMQECKILGRIPASSSSLVLLSQTCRNAELYEHEMATCLRRSTNLLILFINIWMAGKMQWHYEIIDNCYVFSLPISAHCNLSGSEVYWGEKELRESGLLAQTVLYCELCRPQQSPQILIWLMKVKQ